MQEWNLAQKEIWLSLVEEGIVYKNDTKMFYIFAIEFNIYVDTRQSKPTLRYMRRKIKKRIRKDNNG